MKNGVVASASNAVINPLMVTWMTLRGFPRPFWVLIVGTFVNKFGTFVMPFLALHLTRKGFTPGQAGLALGAYGVGHLIASALGGHLADRLGRRNTIMMSMFSAAGAMMALACAEGIPLVLLLALLTGLTAELYRPASAALLADLVPPGERLTAFSAYRLAINAGWAFGPATAGLLTTHSFFCLFLGDAATSALFGLVAWAALPHGIRPGKEESHWSEALATMRQDRRFLQIIIASLAVGLVFMQMSSTLGLHVTSFGFSAATYGALISLNGVIVVLCELPLTSFVRRLPVRVAVSSGFALIGLGFGLNAFARTVPAFAGGVLVFTLGEMMSMPVAAAYVAELAPAQLRGRYMGAYGTTWALALVFGPGLGMLIFARNPSALWLGCGALGLVAALILRRSIRNPAKPAS